MSHKSVSQKLDRNFRFVGLLDSAKTAQPVPSATEITNWWMPTEEDTHLLHCAAAEVMTIKQVLWGEIPQLPRNQSFDSPAWLNLADYFVRSELPLFSICVLGKEATPDAFVEDCAQQFKPTSDFSLSAWPDLTDGQRNIIAGNISKHGNFKEMFAEISLDSRWISTFERQQDILQRMLIYLEKKYKLEPQLIRKVDYAPTTTWYRIERDYKDPNFISSMRDKYDDNLAMSFKAVFEEIKTKATRDIKDNPVKREQWLSSRTNLFKEIHSEPRELREILRAEIDRCYVETTSESVTDIGQFIDADRADTDRPVDNRFYDSMLVDMGNDPIGLQEYHIIDFKNLEYEKKSIKDFLEVMNDKGVGKRLKWLRKIRNWGVPTKDVEEIEEDHLNMLCEELPNNVIKREQKLLRIAWSVGEFAVNVTIGHVIGDSKKLVDGVLKEITSEAISEITESGLDAVKAQERINKYIAKKRHEALAGILRDWLTKRITIDDQKLQ